MQNEYQIPVNVINIFEIIALYLTDKFYNDIYYKAEIESKGGSGMTNLYKSHMVLYYKTIAANHSDWLISVISKLKVMFKEYKLTSYIITTNECVNTLVQSFIPEEFVECINHADKHSIIYLCLSNVVSSTIDNISKNSQMVICPDHNNPAKMAALKDVIIELLIIEREKMQTRFISDSVKSKNGMVDEETVKRFRKNLKAAEQQIEALQTKYNDLTTSSNEQIANLSKKCQAIHTAYETHKIKYEKLLGICKQLKQQLIAYKQAEAARAAEPEYEPELEPNYIQDPAPMPAPEYEQPAYESPPPAKMSEELIKENKQKKISNLIDLINEDDDED